jgi:hypothetical protein
MARAGIRELVFGLAAAGLLAGCVDGTGGTGAGGESSLAAGPAKKRGAAQDVEAPEVFQATDSALWDGRPSLGGIWVAAPDVTNPERAIMFNPATGKSVTGALFKRERDNPGPRLQLSSDAAEALGILAGQPTEIRVTAVRKAEEPEAETADEAAAASATAAATAEGEAAAPGSDADAAAIATAALDAVDAEKTKPEGEANAADPAAVAAGAAVAAAGAAEGAAAVVVDEKPKRKTWKERRAEAKAAREAKKRAAAEAAAAASAAEAAAATGEGEVPTATADGAAVAPIESAPLDARNADVAAGTAEKPKRRTVGEASAPAAAAAAEEAPPAAGGPVRPIQVASFSKEENAKRAAEALAKIGVAATPQKSEKAGKAVWGVIVQGDEAMLKKIKDAGFADAYFLN